MKLNPSATAYLKHLASCNRHPETVRQYHHGLRLFCSYLGRPAHFADVSADDLAKYQIFLKSKGLAASTCQEMMRKVVRLFKWLEKTKQIFTNPALDVVLPERDQHIGFVPTPKQVRRLLAQPDISRPTGIRDRAIFEVLYGCGLRRMELTRLTVHDPDLKNGALTVNGKGQKQRQVPLGKKAAEWIRRYLVHGRPQLLKSNSSEPRLWISIQRTPVCGQAIYEVLRRYAKSAGIEGVTLHSLRRACVTHMLQNGAHPFEIKLLLGHASLKHLHHYLKVNITDIRNTHRKSRPGR
jgi:integrase/recombinase XerD